VVVVVGVEGAEVENVNCDFGITSFFLSVPVTHIFPEDGSVQANCPRKELLSSYDLKD